jgi:hypothetical protein
MGTKDSLSAALKLVLQKNWLHQEECLDKLQQLAEPEISYLLAEAHRRREQEAAHTVEPFGAAVAAVLAETLCAYMAEEARYWTDDEKVRLQLGALLVLRQYLSADDRNMPRKKVLKYLQDETYLCETWGLTTIEANTIRTAIENISPKLYSLRLGEGIGLLSQALCRAATFECANQMPGDEVSQPEIWMQWADEDDIVDLDGEVDQAPQRPTIEVNRAFWFKLLRQARHVMIFDETFAVNEAPELTLAEVKAQLALMEARHCLKRMSGSEPIGEARSEETWWYRLTDKTWDLLGPDNALLPAPSTHNQPLSMMVEISQPIKAWGEYLVRQLGDNLPKLRPDWYRDVAIGLWLICVALALAARRYELYFPVIMLIPLIWETYRKTVKAS